MIKPTAPIDFSPTVLASARDYVPALLEACGDDVAPVDLLLDTAAYPKILRRVEMAEFIVGWFHGVSEACGGDNVRETYAQLLAAVSAKRTTAKRTTAKAPPVAKRTTAKRTPANLAPAVAMPAVKPDLAPALPPAPISKREALAPLYSQAPAPAPQSTPPASPRARRGRFNQPSLGF